MSDPSQLDDTILSVANQADDLVTLRVTPPVSTAVPEDLQTLIVAKPATSPTQATLKMSSPKGANPDSSVPFIFGRRIAQGGMGAILEADDCKLGRKIAVKVMRLDRGASEKQKQRFIQEAAVLGRLEHPNIVPVHDLGRDSEGELYYTMKLVKGRTLQRILDDLRREHPEALAHYTLDRLLTIFRKICDALAFAHAQKIIHRDLKPENIMVGEFGEALVMDWGLSKLLGSNDETRAPDADPSPLASTMDGAVMGTPNYMSPEQAMGKINEMDARSDIFSLGGILYAILTLRPPVEGKDVGEVLEKVSSANITAPATLGAAANDQGQPKVEGEVLEAKMIKPLPHMPSGRVPPALSAVAMKALTLDKAKRYPNIEAFSADIEKYQNGFATGAEQASLLKQLILLIQRHKGVFATVAAAWLIITALAGWFILSIRASERETRRQADIAMANEQIAVERGESTRRALAKAQIALAEAAYRDEAVPAMQAALAIVPEDLRDSNWHYLLAHTDMSLGVLELPGNMRYLGVDADPSRSGVFALASADCKITFIEARSRKTLEQFEFKLPERKRGEVKPLRLAVSPDGAWVAIGDSGAPGVVIHEVKTGRKLAECQTLLTTVHLGFSPDGQGLLQSSPPSLTFWEASSGNQLWEHRSTLEFGGTRAVGSIFDPNGKRVLACAPTLGIRVLDVGTGSIDEDLPVKMQDQISVFAFCPDGSGLLVADLSGNVRMFDAQDWHKIFEGKARQRDIQHVAFTADGSRFVTVGPASDGRQAIEVWDAATGRSMNSLLGGIGAVSAMAVHPISREMLITSPFTRLWEIPAPIETKTLTGAAGLRTRYAHFMDSDDRLLAPTKESPTRPSLLNLDTGQTLWTGELNPRRISVSGDGQVASISAMPGSAAKAFKIEILRTDPEGNTRVTNSFTAPKKVNTPVPPVLSPSGDRLLVPRARAIYDTYDGTRLTEFDFSGLALRSTLAWSSDGSRLFGLGTANGNRGQIGAEEQIAVWDAFTGKQLQTKAHPTTMDCLAIAPDCRSLVEAGTEKMIRIRDAATLEIAREFRAHDGPVTALAWSPNGKVIASGSADLTIKLWDAVTGKLLEELRGPLAATDTLNFSPSGKRLASAGPRDATRIWEPKSLQK